MMRRSDTPPCGRAPRRAAALLLLLAAAAPAVGEGDPEAPEAPSATSIDRAIERGVEFLKREQAGDGSFDREAGLTGLSLYALAHSGVKADDHAMKRGMRWLAANLVRPDVYDASLAILAMATLDPKENQRKIERLARMIELSQCDNGQWSYALRGGRSSGDNSNTQFAILALNYARRTGRAGDLAVAKRCREYFVKSQNEDGGWGYSAKERSKSYGSMTAAGVAALVTATAAEKRVALADEAIREGDAVRRATEWLAENFAVDANPGANFKLGGTMRGIRKEITDSYWRYYWLFSLERAATLAGLEKLGDRDWYAEGTKALIAEQRDDGSWVGSEAPVHATCFALLFLSRSGKRSVHTERPAPNEGVVTPR